jgi:hypothetical protein
MSLSPVVRTVMMRSSAETVPGDILEISIPTEANERECGLYHQLGPTNPSRLPSGRVVMIHLGFYCDIHANVNMILGVICARRIGAMIWTQDGNLP